MKCQRILMEMALSTVICLGTVVMAWGQDAQPGGDVMWTPAPAGNRGGQRGGPEGRRMGVFGKISAIGSDSIEVTGPEGNKVTLNLASSTEFRRDRQPAKLSDFKLGDPVMVRTDQANGNPTTAVMVVSGPGFGMRSGQGGGPGGGGPGMMTAMGTLGKDYVVGEVKAIDAPQMTVLRTDNISQTLELNEETSLHRGRDSITMANIQVGDHVFARGAVENNVFVPKDVRVIPPEMWKRMQEMNAGGGASSGGGSAQPANPSAPSAPPSPVRPPGPRN